MYMMALVRFKNMLAAFNRRKTIDHDFESPLRRCLIFWDLFLLGVGGSVDVALYILLGNVIRDFCGPAIIISMIIGFFLCFTSGLFYAEFASYVPTSGSDYDYIYSTLGELYGFLDGWSILVGSIIATSALAQGAADLMRSLTDSATYDYLDAHAALPDHALLSANVNIVATALVVLVIVITALGVQSSVRINDVIVSINLLVILFTFITGLFYVDFDNWSGWDKFAPYGINGILKSLPYTIFFYGGFISITFSTEEVIDPQRNLPRSIISSIIGIFVCFFCVGIVLSLVIPYNQLSSVSPLSDAFATVAFKQSKYIIAFGGLCACFSSVLTACYANSRLSYVMARDGLLMNFLHIVSPRSLVPVRAVLITGSIAATLAAFVDLTILIEVCSILTLLPYMTLGTSVILLRYKEQDSTNEISNGVIYMNNGHEKQPTNTESHDVSLAADNLTNGQQSSCHMNVLFESKNKPRIIVALVVLFLSSASISLVLTFGISYELATPVLVTVGIVATLPLLVSIVVIYRTPHQVVKFPFTVPMFPILPTVCLSLCIFVMFQFSMWAWILFVINTVLGIIIYVGYGVKNSKVNSVNVSTAYIESNVNEDISLSTRTEAA